MHWLAENWWIVLGVFNIAIFVIALVHYRRNPEAPGARSFFKRAPLFDPTGKTPTGWTPRALLLWFVGMLIVLFFALAEMVATLLA